jgi:putative ABC transport system permease protein
MLTTIALGSLKQRKSSVLLTLLSIVISVSLLLTVETVRHQVKSSFASTVSGVDIIVGAPSGEINLLLSSVFRIGSPTKAIAYSNIEMLTEHRAVEWVIPLSLGDTHNGFRVVGTSNAYFKHFMYGNKTSLVIARGKNFISPSSAVLGADVAAALNYDLGNMLVLAHGLGNVSFKQHANHPFLVSGILAKTGTPVDKAIYVTLEGLDAAHDTATSSISHIKKPNKPTLEVTAHEHDHLTSHSHEHESHHRHEDTSKVVEGSDNYKEDYTPQIVSVAMLGLKNRVAALQLQYQLNQNKTEPLSAILPGVVLSQLWNIMGNIEGVLLGISLLIVVASLFGLTTMLLASMRERRHEMAILRTIGASPLTLLILIQLEALLVSLAGCVISLLVVATLLFTTSEWIGNYYGLYLSGNIFNIESAIIVTGVLAATLIIACFPAVSAYRQGLHSGLNQT